MFKKVQEFYAKNFNRIGKIIILALIFILYILPPIFESLNSINSDLKIQVILGTVCIYLLFITNKTHEIEKKISRDSTISKDYHEYSNFITNKIRNEDKKEAKLLEYSTNSIKVILDAIDKSRFKTKVLVKHPESAINKFQRNKIWLSICDFYVNIENLENFEIKFYKNTAALRARHIGDTISIGHYLYHEIDDPKKKGNKIEDIIGHLNPLISYDIQTLEGGVYLNLFNKYFERYWKNATSLKEICKSCKDEHRKKVCPRYLSKG